jgi:gliding motility-associated-like protein
MRKYILFLAIAVCCSMVANATPPPDNSQQPLPGSPLAFRENKGQVQDQLGMQRSDIQFQLNTNGTSVFIGKGKIHYQWNQTEKQDSTTTLSSKDIPAAAKITGYRMDVTLLGCNMDATIIKEEILPGFDLFYSAHLDGVKAYSYQKITYRNIYPGIDWVLYVKDRVLKYDFVVRPGGKVSDIKMRYEGARELNIREETVVAVTPLGSLTEQKPYAYIAETGQTVSSAFTLNKNILGFTAGTFNGTLVIDPELRLEWGTYYGGIAPEPADAGIHNGDWVSDNYAMIATDGSGNIYLTGTTMSNENIATTGSFQSTRNNATNVFLVKFNSRGERQWATYYGGSAASYSLSTHTGLGHAVACDTIGNVYLAGCTWNTEGIATPNAYQVNKGGAPPPQGGSWYWPDLFLVKFDSNGQRQWATYYGGTQAEGGGSVAVTPDGNNIYLAGTTDPNAQNNDNVVSPNAAIPYTGTTNNMPQAGFLARFNASGQRIWGSYTNPTTRGHTIVMDIAADNEGHIYLTGSSHADPGSFSPVDTSIVTWGSFQQQNNSPFVYGRDAFLQQWDSEGNRLWSTFYGGGGSVDLGCGIVCDDIGNVYLTGITDSDFGFTYGAWCIATQGSYKEVYTGGYIGFLAKFNGAGQRQWGTYFKGQGAALAYAGAQVYLAGSIAGDSLATTCAWQEDYAGTNSGFINADDAFLARFNTSGFPDYITYYGGTANDIGTSLAIHHSTDERVVYLAGGTRSHEGIATPGSHKEVLIGNEYDAFLAKFYTPYLQEITSCFQEDSIRISARDTSVANYQWNNNATGHSQWIKTSGLYTVNYQRSPGCISTDSFLVHIYPLPVLTAVKGCPGEAEAVVTVGPDNKNLYTYSWYDASGNLLKETESSTGDRYTGLGNGDYTLKILTPVGCDTFLPVEIETFPGVTLTVCSDTTIAARGTANLWASGADRYSWSPDRWLNNAQLPHPLSSPHEPITYIVTGTNQYGCRATDSVRIDIMEHLFIPNAFSPNGDGKNDEFRIANYGFQQLLEFRIFNRWGEQVFGTLNPDKGWNGTYKGSIADQGTYSYYIRVQEREGRERIFKGDVILIR